MLSSVGVDWPELMHRCFLKLREQSQLLFVKPESMLLEDNEWGFNISGTIPTMYIPYMFRRLINKIFYLMSAVFLGLGVWLSVPVCTTVACSKPSRVHTQLLSHVAR